MSSAQGTTAAPQKVLIGRSPTPTDTLIELDAAVSEEHASESQITDHPVEEGADITDHVRRQPRRLVVNGWFSNHPILKLASENAQGIAGGDPQTRAQDAFAELERIKDAGTLVAVRTTLKTYESMIITSLSAPRDARRGSTLDVTIGLREIVTATTELVEPPEPVVQSKKPRQNVGRQQTRESPPENEAKQQSLAVQGINSLFR